MNTIYIKKQDKNVFIDNYKSLLNDKEGNNKSDTITFYKKDTRRKLVLYNIFPKVLASLIFEYDINGIDVQYTLSISDCYGGTRLQRFTLYLWIDECDLELNIDFVYRPRQHFYNEVCGANFIMDAQFVNSMFINPFLYFNKFMLKYYNKRHYFDNFFNYIKDSDIRYANAKQVKYGIIITKIITDIIQYTNVHDVISVSRNMNEFV